MNQVRIAIAAVLLAAANWMQAAESRQVADTPDLAPGAAVFEVRYTDPDNIAPSRYTLSRCDWPVRVAHTDPGKGATVEVQITAGAAVLLRIVDERGVGWGWRTIAPGEPSVTIVLQPGQIVYARTPGGFTED